MPARQILPDELVSLAAEHRLIPFLGAGFSSAMGLPSWESMLSDVCSGAENSLPFDELMESTGKDLLRVAEYLYLKHDRQIGPIRHQIEHSFATSPVEPLLSGPHVELVNLGANQIYTTNYDDILERTYRALGLPITPVILPKDVALADTDRTQIVKYHGDLKHEKTLVLTESAYYQRMDFESPMDLKFRSDLLGKSVLFIGYSFRDINIRIIWFKLMEMMRDIPESDRRPSYIVRLDPNPALEELYSSVGLRTIVLNPDGPPVEGEEAAKLVGDFLLQLSARASTRVLSDKVGAPRMIYVSRATIEYAKTRADSVRELYGIGLSGAFRFGGILSAEDPILRRMISGVVPESLRREWSEAYLELLPYLQPDSSNVEALSRVPASERLTSYVVETLAATGRESIRISKRQLVAKSEIWTRVWRHGVSREIVEDILSAFAREIRFQAVTQADEDVAYLAELTTRIRDNLLTKIPVSSEVRAQAKELLGAAAVIYPSIAELSPTRDRAPQVGRVLAEVTKREKRFTPVDINVRTILGDGKGSGRRRNGVAASALDLK